MKYLKTGKKYHSSNISNRVANGFASSPIIEGSRTTRPTIPAIVPKITLEEYTKDHSTKRVLHNSYVQYL